MKVTKEGHKGPRGKVDRGVSKARKNQVKRIKKVLQRRIKSDIMKK